MLAVTWWSNVLPVAQLILTGVTIFWTCLKVAKVLEGWELPPPSPVLMEDGQPTDSAFNFPYDEAQLEEVAKMLGG